MRNFFYSLFIMTGIAVCIVLINSVLMLGRI